MNREIKFRAWYGDGQMKYNVGIHPFMIFRLSSSDICEEGEYDDNTGDLVVAPGAYKVMQYTGLKDRNGKEGYEKDIVRSKHGQIGIIRYNQSEALYEIFWVKGGLASGYASALVALLDCEIIGNEFENPDLVSA